MRKRHTYGSGDRVSLQGLIDSFVVVRFRDECCRR